MTLKQFANSVVTEQQKKTASIKTALKALVKNLPDDPGVTRINDRCAIVSSSKVFSEKNLSAGYYLNNEVKTRLTEIIDSCPIEKLEGTIDGILKAGAYPEKGYAIYGSMLTRINPVILRTLRDSWDPHLNLNVKK